ncbi:ArnT family glycosyltransferase [Halodesulfovibrio aestuarii]|uniref:Dolichyl-phosphate-mannose-protein mannosyltransferase n=1 Tax=Halodesulfovibrio aestuarii TaxID=126333 RepID=A0A8G2CA58_9BACT|nr:glycosyltransferase family 39 protein [Halodesulfovibrio aestuarii]SHJ26580.1 Dolichyl-phosphate-mannose-protein mannosyltransferase [Halodesulfovibrio aestuarii]
MNNTAIWQRHPYLVAAAIIVCTTCIRIAFLWSNQLDLVYDEAQYWDWTRHMQLSYYSKGPLIAWIIKGWTTLLGNTQFGVRFGAVFNSFLTQSILLYGLGRMMKRPVAALWAVILANTIPLFLASGVLMTTDSPLLVCWLVALFAVYAASENPERKMPYVLLGAVMALGILAKYMMLAMVGVVFFYCIGLWRRQMLSKIFVKRVAIAMAVGTVVGFLPILIWNLQNDWVGFRHVAKLAGVNKDAVAKPFFRFDRFPEYFGSQIGLITPWWFAFLIFGGWTALKQGWTKKGAEILGDNSKVRQAILLSTGFWMLWGFFIFWSFHTRIYPNWSAMSYAAGIILAAIAVEQGHVWGKNALVIRSKRIPLRKTGVVIGIVLFLVMHSLGELPFRTRSFNPAMRLMGWTDMSSKLQELTESMPHPDKVFYFSDRYGVTANLSFYAPGQPQAFCADFGRRKAQYDLWETPEDKTGWDAIFVRHKPIDVRPLKKLFESVKVMEYQTTHTNGYGPKYYIAILKNYNGEWPKRDSGSY